LGSYLKVTAQHSIKFSLDLWDSKHEIKRMKFTFTDWIFVIKWTKIHKSRPKCICLSFWFKVVKVWVIKTKRLDFLFEFGIPAIFLSFNYKKVKEKGLFLIILQKLCYFREKCKSTSLYVINTFGKIKWYVLWKTRGFFQ